jgi:hypothetical protein
VTTTGTEASPAPLRPFVVHGIEDDRDITVPVMATSQQDALDRSGLSCGWIHDDTVTDCPRCAAVLAEAVPGA